MTPAYASPEQVTGGLVSTATDVYALGLVLDELLWGRPAQRLQANVRPDAIALARRTTPARLARHLRGDLGRICAKALRKDPDQRYATAAQMAEDSSAIWTAARSLPARRRPSIAPRGSWAGTGSGS